VFSKAALALRRERGTWRLDATISGEPVNPGTHELRADVKGVTKHLYALVNHGAAWTVRVVLDV